MLTKNHNSIELQNMNLKNALKIFGSKYTVRVQRQQRFICKLNFYENTEMEVCLLAQ